ncbi:MAG TPA: biopolymer transporter ExbD [Thermoanaerobaculia bacterium]|nr:biopolymer transporter ExbD [Thermoanaerobaculia bacterium]
MREKTAPRRSGRLHAEMNVTPLVDVTLVLLIIFMVMVPAITRPVDVPETAEPARIPENERQIRVVVFEPDLVGIGSLVLRYDQLQGELERIFEQRPEAEVVVMADEDLAYETVLSTLRACRDTGFASVGLAAERRKA